MKSRILTLASASIFSACGTLVALALTLVFTRYGDLSGYGEYAIFVAEAAVLTVIVDYAVDKSFVKFVSGSGLAVCDCISTVMCVKLILFSLVGLLVTALSLLTESQILHWQALFFILSSLNLGFIFELEERTVSFAKILLLERFLVFFLSVITLNLFGFGVQLYVAYGLSIIISLIVQAFACAEKVREFRFVELAKLSNFLVSFFSVFVINLCALGYAVISRLIISDKIEVEAFALISIAFQFVGLASIVQTQADRIYRPVITNAVKIRSRQSAYAVVGNYMIIVVIPMAIASVGIFSFSAEIIPFIYGKEFAGAASAVAVLSPLFITVALLRLGELFAVALGAANASLVIGTFFIGILLGVLYFSELDGDHLGYLRVIVVSQAVHLTVLLGYMDWIMRRKRGSFLV